MSINRKEFIDNLILILLILWIPNFFVEFNSKNLEHEATSLYSLSKAFYSIFIGYVSILIIMQFKLLKLKKYFVVPLLFYSFFIVTIYSQPMGDLIKSLFRICEYLFFFLYLIYYDKKYNLNYDRFIILLKWIFNYLYITLIVGLMFFQHKIFNTFDVTGETFSRLGGSVIGPNTVGFITSIAILYYLYTKTERYRFLYILLNTVILLASYSRGAILSLIVVIAVVSFMGISFRSKIKYIILFSIVGVIGYIFSDFIINFLSRGQGIEGLLTLSERSMVWFISLNIIRDHLFFGIGFGEASNLIGQIMENQYSITHWKAPNTHNDFIQSVFNFGVGYLLFTIYVYIKIYLNIRDLNNNFLFSLLFSLIIYSMTMTSINFYMTLYAALIWIFFICSYKLKLGRLL